jgi:hypothetical protein
MTIYLIRDTTYHVAEGYMTTYEAARQWIKDNKEPWTYEVIAVDELSS